MIIHHIVEHGYPVKCTTTKALNSGFIKCKLVLHHWQTSKQCYTTHTAGRGKNKQKSSPSVLSDAEVPRPVSPLSDVPGRRPKRLWNFSDTAGVCHSMSANRANVYLWNGTTEEYINTCWTDVQFMHSDCRVSTYPLVWIRCISVRLSFHARQCHLIEMRVEITLSHNTDTLKRALRTNSWNILMQVC